MKDLQSRAATAGAQGKLHASVALAGLAATMSMPAGAAIVSVADLNKAIGHGETYYLPGVPYIRFGASQYCLHLNLPDKSCTYQTYGWVTTQVTWGEPKMPPVSGGWFAAGVSAGDVIGPGAIDPSGRNYSTSPWETYDHVYMALEFLEAGDRHYGWVNFSVPQGDGDFIIHAFGYNDAPNASIRVGQTTDIPEPSTLALLAVGVVGAAAGSARRRRAQR